MHVITLGRVYDPPRPGEGLRVLVDRLWPRGLSKDRAALDLWSRDVAPSDALRRAYHAGGMGWDDFAARYRAELDANPALAAFRAWLADRDVVLLTATRDLASSHAAILRDRLA